MSRRPDAEDLSVQTPGPELLKKMNMKYLIKALVRYQASDLHIKPGRPPLYRINGKLVPSKMPELTTEEVQRIIYGVLTEAQVVSLEQDRQVDFSFWISDMGRFRCNVYMQRGWVSAAIRMVPLSIPSLGALDLPPVVEEIANRPHGLILVTGPTGSGKSTTMAAMVRHINETRYAHILCLEDPIEFIHQDIKSSITQREIGSDASTYQDGLYGGLRQDPDVIVIGEMRSRETIQAALTAAETGHLVISTLHTSDVVGTINRILDVFPADGQNQVRMQLASSLVGIVAQRLLLRADKKGRVPVCEVMVKSPSIENCLIKDDRSRIPEVIENSSTYYKMQTMNMALERLLKLKIITLKEALKVSNSPEDLKLRLSGIVREEGFPSDFNRRAG